MSSWTPMKNQTGMMWCSRRPGSATAAATLRPPPPLRSPFGCDSMRPLTFPCAPPLDAARGLGPATRLPENPLQDQKDREAQTRPEDGPLYDWKFAFARQIRRAVNQPRQLRVRPRLRQRGDDHGDGDADDPRPQRAPHVLSQGL